MIRQLTFTNFCSFLEETVVDFTTSGKTPVSDSFVSSRHGDQVSLLTGVFGPNGAGKTNLLKGLSFVSFFLRSSYRQLEPQEAIPLDHFAGHGKDQEASFFEIEFEGASGRYRYSAKLSSEWVHEETLKLFSSKTGKFRTILSRKSPQKDQLRLTGSTFTEISLLRKTLLDRPNCSMIAAGLQSGRKEFQKLIADFGLVATNVTRHGKKEQPFEGLTSDIFRCSEFFHEHPEYHDALRELLTSADIGILDFEIKPVRLELKEGKYRETFLAFFKHQGPKGEFTLSANQESSGTRRLYMLCETFVRILSQGGIAVIDEMESDLHPHLIPTIFSIFTSPEMNTKQAQLFFTCHHFEMLNHLEKEQIFLVEKNEQSISEAYRLDELAGVRREENFFANYNSGRYGAVPEPEVVAF